RPGGARAARARGPARLPHAGVRGGDDAAGRRGVPARGRRGAVPRALAGGGGPARPEADAAAGRAALQKPRVGAQGAVGAPAGVQPGARADGAGGAAGGGAAAATELQRGGAGGPSPRGGGAGGASQGGGGGGGGGARRWGAPRG